MLYPTAPYVANNKLVTFAGAVNEWTLYGLGSAYHPLHVHVNHMQVQGTDAASAAAADPFYRAGQWRDTLPPVADMLTFRFVAADFTGETVLHCHFQRHEDLGMMDTYLVMDKDEYLAYFVPTTAPTARPSEAPSAAPSRVPSAEPSAHPTAMPSTLTETTLSFNITTRLTDVTATEFLADAATGEAFEDALADYLNISASGMSILAVQDDPGARRLLRTDVARGLAGSQGVYVVARVLLIVEQEGYASGGALLLYEWCKAALAADGWAAALGWALARCAARLGALALELDASFSPAAGDAEILELRTAAPSAAPAGAPASAPSSDDDYGGVGLIGVVIIAVAVAVVCIIAIAACMVLSKQKKSSSAVGDSAARDARKTKQIEIVSAAPTEGYTAVPVAVEETAVVKKKKKQKNAEASL
jgi:hypothetical protein